MGWGFLVEFCKLFSDGASFFGDDSGHVFEITVHLVEVAFGAIGITGGDSLHGIAIKGE